MADTQGETMSAEARVCDVYGDQYDAEGCNVVRAVSFVDAVRVAEAHAAAALKRERERAEGLREALEAAQGEIQGIQGLRRGNAPHRVYAAGLFGCERIDSLANKIDSALAAWEAGK